MYMYAIFLYPFFQDKNTYFPHTKQSRGMINYFYQFLALYFSLGLRLPRVFSYSLNW